MNPSSQRPLLMLIAFVAILAAPVPWLVPALVGVALALTAARAAHTVISRRARVAAGTASDAAIGLGTDRRGREIVVSERELAAHALILGASGAGKTTSLLRILTEQIRRGRPVIGDARRPRLRLTLGEIAVRRQTRVEVAPALDVDEVLRARQDGAVADTLARIRRAQLAGSAACAKQLPEIPQRQAHHVAIAA